ncbi:hypothetical protein HYFRA_00012625 [Hymenoscyphus fraxineus]|uniref:Zinc finger PHD-type domain-containing protein n=1 Tax=Hymenoscyphus fraxineus TaxID=746836 RepID=A0A9N9L849_9HELO|nr:hypothetical protein HYFRA_00012625 [Hymenoscyphus fraxineus]
MTKRKRPQQTSSKAVWHREDEWVLLGLLDFCIKHKSIFPFEEAFVVGRIHPKDRPGGIYSWKQIISKLCNHLWRRYGKEDSPSKEEILKNGSAELVIPDQERIHIKTQLEKLERELKPVILPVPRIQELREIPGTREATSLSPSQIEDSHDLPDTVSIQSPKAPELSPSISRKLQALSDRSLKTESARNKQAPIQPAEEEEEEWLFNCPCGVYGQVDDGTHSIACDRCNIWQHSKCVRVSQTDAEREGFSFLCGTCKSFAADEDRAESRQRVLYRHLPVPLRDRAETDRHVLDEGAEHGSSRKQPDRAGKTIRKQYKKSEPRRSRQVNNSDLVSHTKEDKDIRTDEDPTTLRLGIQIQKAQRYPKLSPESLETLHRAEIRKKDNKITKLEEKITIYEEKSADSRTKRDSFRVAENGDVHQAIYQLTQEIKSLKTSKEEYMRTRKFAALKGDYGAAYQEMNMEETIAGIRHDMKNVVGDLDDEIALRYPGAKPTAGLLALLASGFGFDDEILLTKSKFDDFVSKYSPYQVIETLMEAAVCTWVLESSFPDFGKPAGSLDIGATYRKLLVAQGEPSTSLLLLISLHLIQGDSIALHNLDLASHYDLIQKPRFQTLLNENAESLTTSLSKTLSPLFPRDTEDSENNLFETWGQDTETWTGRRERMIDIFRASLVMKSHSVLTPGRYELIRYPPDSLFDPLSMEIDGGSMDVGEGQRVKLCLHVAIQVLPTEEVKDGDAVEKAIVQSKNFTCVSESDRLNSGIVLVKAVIVLS